VVQAIQVKCPNCAAVLRVGIDAAIVACDYCHTQSQIQRRTRMLQLPIRMPARGGAAPPARVARQVVRRAVLGFSLLSMLTPLAITGVVAFFIDRHGEQAVEVMAALVNKATGESGAAASGRATGSAERPGGARWTGLGPPLLADVDGDGTADVVGRMRHVHDGDRATVAALSGATGTMLWESARIGTYSDTIQGRVAIAGDVVLFAGATGALTAVGLADGKPRFEGTLPDRPVRFCRKGSGAVAIETDDGAWHEIALAGGAPRRIRKERSCDRLRDDERSEIDPGIAVDESPRRWNQPGMHVNRELRRGGGPVLVAGWRRPGTAVPMVGRLDARRRLAWKAELPEGNPLEARAGARGLWTATDRLVCATYEQTGGDGDRVHVTCFEIESGERAWDIAVPGDRTTVLSSIVAAGDRLYLSGWGLLLGIDAATGRWAPGFGP
jgi:hypothetical protein